MLESLRYVDGVFVFCEETPIEAIRALLPDLLVKGGDYEVTKIVGYTEVTEAGGRVETVPIVAGFSTTDVIGKVISAYK